MNEKFIEENYDTQNTKNEQQKDLCITSEQLTEQWKYGKLSEGWYWVKGSRTKGIYAYTAEYLDNTYRPINGESVLAKVPDYTAWQNLWNTADMEHKANNKLLEDVERLEKENKELKELLKECIPYFNALVEKRLKLEYIPQVYELLTKINEVLK